MASLSFPPQRDSSFKTSASPWGAFAPKYGALYGLKRALHRVKRSNLTPERRGDDKNGAIWFIHSGGTTKTERFDSSTTVEREKRSDLVHLRRWNGKNGAF